MFDLRNTLELVNWARDLISQSGVQLLDPFWTAVACIGAGFVLAFWGGRVLRAAFVFAAMTAGAVAGKRFAATAQVDLLIGLVLGAGVAALVGYLLYRWWLGLTMAIVTGLVVAATFSAPRLLNERQAFDDFRLGVGSGQYDTRQTPLYSMTDVRDYFWQQRREFVYRTLGPVAVAALLGLAVGIIAPRLAAILGTSVMGVVVLAGGAGALAAMKFPDWWNKAQAHETWLVGAIVCVWLFAVMYQVTHPVRPAMAAPVLPAPAPGA
jgi:hypothetical protein